MVLVLGVLLCLVASVPLCTVGWGSLFVSYIINTLSVSLYLWYLIVTNRPKKCACVKLLVKLNAKNLNPHLHMIHKMLYHGAWCPQTVPIHVISRLVSCRSTSGIL